MNKFLKLVQIHLLFFLVSLDISFEETLRRHQTKPNCASFGAKEMRKWWRDKDFSTVLQEVSITDEKDMQSIVAEIYHTILNEEED